MDMKPQELIKSLVKEVGALIDARIRTAEITIKAGTDASIKASEERLTKRIDVLEQGLHRVEQKLNNNIQDHEDRIETIEEHIGLPHKN